MGWRQESSEAGAFIWDSEPMTADDLALRDEEMAWLLAEGRKDWKLINGRISRSGQPTMMAEGTYGALGSYPPAGTLTGLTLSTTEGGLIPAANIATYTPIPPNSTLAPQAWRYVICGVYTVTTTPGSVIFTPRIGNANSSPSLGASAAIALTASLTNAFWCVVGDLTIRSIGAPGTNSKANSMQRADVNTAVGGAYNSALWGTGTTDASFDGSIALGTNGGGLWLGGTDSGATNHATLSVQQVHWMDWN